MRMAEKSGFYVTRALSLALLATTGTGVFAQEATGDAEVFNADDTIVVTGSRIARKDFSSESPVVTVGRDILDAAGPSTIETTLNQLPQFAATAGSSSTSTARGGRSNANLRGFGITRTLVLTDGRRMQPSDPLGAVDLNTIPSALVENVEIITGGASAVYGSDAIAGVVNFRLRRNFEGFEIDAQQMITGHGDGRALDLSATLGGNFADGRGNAVLSVSFMDRQEVKRRSREFFRNGGVTAVLPSGLLLPDAANLPSQAAINAVFSRYGVTDNIPRNSRFSMNPDGTLFTGTTPIYNFRWPEGGPYVISGGNVGVPIGEAYPLQQPLQRFSVFGKASYDLTDNLTAYTQFSYTHYTADQNLYGRNQAITRDVYIPVTNPFLNDDMRAIMASRPDPDAPLLYYFQTGRLGPSLQQTTYNVSQITGGFRGDLGILDATWDVYASYGRTEQDTVGGNYVDRAAFLSLIEAPDGGASICEGGFNPFIIAKPSLQCLDYLIRGIQERTTLEQINAEATLQGRLFSLPAGDARFAAGVGYRKNSYSFRPDATRLTGSLLTIPLSGPTDGSTNTKEAFVELLLPVLKDLPLIRRLDLSLAYRYSHYDTAGGVHTYKAGADWEIFRGLSARGGYQRAIRAPSAGELFQPSEQGATTVGRTVTGGGDPCDITSAYRTGSNAAQVRALCIANGVPESVVDLHRFSGTNVQSNMSGNRNLKEETADTFTAGLVWRSQSSSPLLRNLSASVDFYDIKIKDAIGLITGEVIAQRCFNGQGNANPDYDPNNFYCGLIHRGSAGNFATITTPLLNLSGYRTQGVDFQVDWRINAGNIGTFGINVLAAYVSKYSIQSLAGAPFVNYTGTIGNAQIGDAISHPEWKTVTSFSFERGGTRLDLRWRWIEAMGHSANIGAANPISLGVKSRSYFDLTASARISDAFQLRGGILNIADKQPPEWTGESATDPAIYDILGRRAFVGVNMKF